MRHIKLCHLSSTKPFVILASLIYESAPLILCIIHHFSWGTRLYFVEYNTQKFSFKCDLLAARQSLTMSPMWRIRKYSLCLQAHFLRLFGYLHSLVFGEWMRQKSSAFKKPSTSGEWIQTSLAPGLFMSWLCPKSPFGKNVMFSNIFIG